MTALQSITVPGSKSIAQRVLICCALCDTSTNLVNLPDGDDVASLITGLEQCGVTIKRDKNNVLITPPAEFKLQESKFDVGHGGTPLRFLVSFLGLIPGTKTLDGSDRLKERPILPLIQSLRDAGGIIHADALPLKIGEYKINKTVIIDGSASSQFVSSLMLSGIALGIENIDIKGEKTSSAYIDLTIDVLRDFGITVSPTETGYHLSGEYTSPGEFIVEPDWASAGYILGSAMLRGADVFIPHLRQDSHQPDAQILPVLETMGGLSVQTDSGLHFTGQNLISPGTINCSAFPDSAMTLAVLCALCDGQTTEITGLSTLPHKECDRIKALHIELKKIGIKTAFTNKTLTVSGGIPHAANIETYNDHRIAMAFGMLQSWIPDLVIQNPEVVSKSFPDFWEKISVPSRLIFVPVFGATESDLMTMIRSAAIYTPYLELRLDLCGSFVFDPDTDLRKLFPAHCTVLYTYRSEKKPAGNIAPHNGFELINVDLENISTMSAIPADKMMLSCHHYGELLADEIQSTIDTMLTHKAKYYKIAVTIDTHAELLTFIEITQNLDKEKWILMGMGKMGEISRILLAGSGFGTFACIGEHTVASGQIDIESLTTILNTNDHE